jgi:hypothetical protein
MGIDINKAWSWKASRLAQPDDAVFDHITKWNRHIFLPLIENNLTIIPLRHPYLTAKSYDDRRRDKGELIESWEILANEIDPLDPHYLPLDVPDRQDYLDALNESVGGDMVTDWMPQGVVHNNATLKYKDVTPCSEIKALCQRIEPFLSKFYAY